MHQADTSSAPLRGSRPAFRWPRGSRATLLSVALLAILALPLFVMFPMVAAQGDSREDRAVLEELFNDTTSEKSLWTNSGGWTTNQPLDAWYGVKTNDAGRVTHLELPDNNLRGPFLTKLGDLAELRVLDLSNNGLTGEIGEIGSVGRLPRLATLNLSNNRLTGTMPNVRDLTALVTLDLSNNEIVGPITFPGGSPNNTFVTLDLSNNPIRTEIPDVVGNLAALVTLNLSNAMISGAVPEEIRNLGKLETLNLSNNELAGPVLALSEGDGMLDESLLTLDLSNNQLTGSAPAVTGTGTAPLVKLTTMKLSGNRFGAGPELGDTLEVLELSDNRLSAIPGLASGVTAANLKLRHLDLSHNRINAAGAAAFLSDTGYLPDVATLETLNLSHNEIASKMPDDLTTLAALKTLDLSHNRQVAADGTISGGFGGAANLYHFANLPKSLTTLDLSHNRITANEIGSNLNALTNLVTLDLSYNRSKTRNVCGSHQAPNVADRCTGLWSELTNLENLGDLETLDLSHNFLDGTVPDLPTGDKLKKVDFSNNRYASLKSSHAITRNTGLEDFNFRCNGLSSFPFDLSPLVNLKKLDLSCNAAGENAFPPWIARVTSLTDLRFADSRLTGDIPDLSGMQDLDTLRLWGNELTGGIGWLSRIPKLYTVNLHGNQLSGPLPNLSNLTNLHHLSLHDNQLTGNISQAQLEQLAANQEAQPVSDEHPGLSVLNLSGNAGLSGNLDLSQLETADAPLAELDVTDTGITLQNLPQGLAMTRLLMHEPPCANTKDPADWPPD